MTQLPFISQIQSKLYDVKRRYGSLASVISLGRSHEGREMQAIKVSDNFSQTINPKSLGKDPILLVHKM